MHLKLRKFYCLMLSFVIMPWVLTIPGSTNVAAQVTEEWVARYDSPESDVDAAVGMVIDPFGFIIVTGNSHNAGTSEDFVTVKYDSDGNEIWVSRYNGPGDTRDIPNDIAVDLDGRIYVTGEIGGISATVAYAPNGTELWVRIFSSGVLSAIATDSYNNVFVTGYGYMGGVGTDCVTIAYDSQGNNLWTAEYDGPGNYYDVANDIGTDSFGNVYITGYAAYSMVESDCVTIAYNSTGKEQWVALYNDSKNTDNVGNALTVDPLGNVHITGYSSDPVTDTDFVTIAYNSSGVELWASEFKGPANANDMAFDLTTDLSQNVYVTGQSYHPSTGTRHDYATVAYDSAGNELWVATYNGPANHRDYGKAIAYHNSGKIYVTGWSAGSDELNMDYAIIAYDTSGNELWVMRYNGPADTVDFAEDIALDQFGNVYVTGVSIGIGTSYDYVTIKYSQESSEALVADAGADQIVNEGDIVQFDGSNSTSFGKKAWDPSIRALWHMNEGMGDLIYDSTRYKNHGTIVNATWTSNGKFGKALTFDGIDDYVEVRPSNEIFGANPNEWSYSVWFRTTNDEDNMTLISDYNAKQRHPLIPPRDPTFAVDLTIEHKPLDYDFSVMSRIGWGSENSSRAYGHGMDIDGADGNWHFVTSTFSKTNFTHGTFIDGFWISSPDHMESTNYFDGDILRIGTRWLIPDPSDPQSGSPLWPFEGVIDEVVLWNRLLTNQEILDYYNSGKEYLANYSTGVAKIVSYEWDFESDGVFDYQETASVALDGSFDGLCDHVYGDDGVYTVTLRVTDENGATATDTCNITVLNVDPMVIMESVTMDVEIGLRVAGRKYNDVGMTLYEDGNNTGYVSIERLPGSPDEQMVWIPLTLDMTKTYSAIVTYIPEDPPNIGGNPVWIYIKLENGSIRTIHHTFNVQQSKKRDSEHWNHVAPWEVDLSSHFIGLPFEITSHITDLGSDDEILTFTYGSQAKTVTYLNNPPNPDTYPSPEVNPRDIMDITTLVYEGPGNLTLVVKDDDNVRLGIGEGTDSLSVG
ncbi:MAG: SBBP repeat-containing protein [Thermoplasmata archaeon]|nr:MAG: SBBP repeat-containing protein [Thermoplasmata archaeon]